MYLLYSTSKSLTLEKSYPLPADQELNEWFYSKEYDAGHQKLASKYVLKNRNKREKPPKVTTLKCDNY